MVNLFQTNTASVAHHSQYEKDVEREPNTVTIGDRELSHRQCCLLSIFSFVAVTTY